MRHKASLLTVIVVVTWLVGCRSTAPPGEVQPSLSPAGTSATHEPVPSPTFVLPPVQMEQQQPAEPAPTAAGPTAAPPPEAPPTPTDVPPPPPVPAMIQHAVEAGETLLGIAVSYNVSMAAIQLANGMGNSVDLLAGQTLIVPGNKQWDGEGYFWTVHVVQSGETLVGVAQAYGLTVDDILRVNAIADPSLIRIDQQLVMPLDQLVTLKPREPTPVAVAAAPQTNRVQSTAPLTAAQTASETLAAAPETPPEALPNPEPIEGPPPGMPAGPGDWPAFILARINQVRAERGLNALVMATELTYAAQAHAEDCARRGWGSHVGSDGAVLQTRLVRAGYAGSNWGENWVQARHAEGAFEWWYGEVPPNDPHRRNILSPRYTEIGIGIAQNGSGYIFITDFGRR